MGPPGFVGSRRIGGTGGHGPAEAVQAPAARSPAMNPSLGIYRQGSVKGSVAGAHG